MPKKNNKTKQTSTDTNKINSCSVKANKNFLEEKLQFLITNPSEKNNFLGIVINNKDLRLLELFAKNGGKLTAKEVLEHFEYIVAKDSIEVLKYFIETLKINFNKSLERINSISPLHFAAMHGAEQCLTYLLNKNYNINKLDGNEYTPLEYAILSKHTNIAKLLIQKGAKIVIGVIHSLAKVYEDSEAEKLLDTIPNKTIKLNSYIGYSNIKQKPDDNIFRDVNTSSKEHISSFLKYAATLAEDAKPRINYYKLILGKDYHLIPRIIEEQQEFVNNNILKLKSITNLDADIKENIIPNIINIISLAENIHRIFRFNEREKLEKYIIDILEKNKNLSEQFSYKLLFFCADLMQEAYETGQFLESIKYAKIIEGNLPAIKNFSQKGQASIFQNLGIIYSHFDYTKAVDYLSKAELINPNDNIIEKKYSIYVGGFHNLEAAITEAEKIADNELKSLLIIHAHKEFLIPQKNISAFNDILLQYGFDKLTTNKFKSDPLKTHFYYDIQAQKHINNGEYQITYNIYDKLLNQAIAANNNIWFFEIISSYLILYFQQHDWINGCKFLDKIYQKYSSILSNHNILKLKTLEFIIYSENDQYLAKSDKILENIKVEALTDQRWVKFISMVYQAKFYNASFNHNIKEQLPSYIKNLEKLYNYSLNNLSFEISNQLGCLIYAGKIIQNILNYQEHYNDNKISEDLVLEEKQIEESKEVIEKSTSTVSNITPQESFVRSLPKEPKLSFKEIEDLIKAENYEALAKHQKQLENYFKHKKEELQNQHMQELFNIKTPISWNTREGKFSSDSENVVKINEDKKLYAVIDPKLENKLGKISYNMFTKALEKGEVTRSKGVDGVKYRDTLITLKVCDQDDRLYTNEIYSNNGNKLIVFNHLGNHEAVNKAASEYEMVETDASVPLIGE